MTARFVFLYEQQESLFLSLFDEVLSSCDVMYCTVV